MRNGEVSRQFSLLTSNFRIPTSPFETRMFTLHETTRRGLCRLGFILLAVVPTSAILVAANWLGSDARRVEHETELSQRLGLSVKLGRVVLPRPNVVRYKGISLADPETNRPLAKAKALELTSEERATT